MKEYSNRVIIWKLKIHKVIKTIKYLSESETKEKIRIHHWRSSGFKARHVHNKTSRDVTQRGKSGFPYHKELLLKERIRLLCEEILSFKRISNFGKGHN